MTVHFCSFELLRFGVARLPDQSLRVSSKSFSKKTNNFISVANYFMLFHGNFLRFALKAWYRGSSTHYIWQGIYEKVQHSKMHFNMISNQNYTQFLLLAVYLLPLQCLLYKPNISLDFVRKNLNCYMYVATQIILLSKESNGKIGTIQ